MSCSELALSAILLSSVVSVLLNCSADLRSSPSLCCFFFVNHLYNGYWDHNISFTFKFLLFFRFLSSFAHIPEREDGSWFLNVL
jgi:hypothetical protein